MTFGDIIEEELPLFKDCSLSLFLFRVSPGSEDTGWVWGDIYDSDSSYGIISRNRAGGDVKV